MCVLEWKKRIFCMVNRKLEIYVSMHSLTHPLFWLCVCPMHIVMSWQIVRLNSSLSIHVLTVPRQIPLLLSQISMIPTLIVVQLLCLIALMSIDCQLFEIYHNVNCPRSLAAARHSSNSFLNYFLLNFLMAAHHQIHFDSS